MGENKNEITAKLIGVRSGLSMISKCTDNIKEAENHKKIESENVDDIKKLLINQKNNVEVLDKKLKDLEFRVKNLSNDLDNYSIETMPQDAKISIKNSFKREKKYFNGDVYKGWLMPLMIWGIGWLIAAVSTVFGIILLSFTVFCLITYPLYVLFTNIGVNMYNKKIDNGYNQKVNEALERKIREYKQGVNYTIKDNKNTIFNLNITKKEEEKRLKEYQDKLNISIENLKRVEDESNIIINENVAVAQSIANSINENYGMMISESDWVNVDLIMHYIITGRADNIKEALLLVDTQRQNDRIVSAIQEATNSINKHISSSINKLGEALEQSFRVLNNSILNVNASIDFVNKQNKIENEKLLKQVSMQNVELHNQTKAINAQNALIEKANATNESLLNDFRYTQQYIIN